MTTPALFGASSATRDPRPTPTRASAARRDAARAASSPKERVTSPVMSAGREATSREEAARASESSSASIEPPGGSHAEPRAAARSHEARHGELRDLGAAEVVGEAR